MRLSAALLLLLLLPVASALTIDSITVSPSGVNVTKLTPLACQVTVTGTGTLTANVTWYRNNLTHVSDNETLSLTSGVTESTSAAGNIETADLTKGEYWKCSATAGNGTAQAASNSSEVLIQNSAPIITDPTTTQTLTEDILYTYAAQAYDPDGDTITLFYSVDLNASQYNNTHLFTMGGNGAISFTPLQAAVGNHTMMLHAYDGDKIGGLQVLYVVQLVDDAPLITPALSNRSATALVPFSYTVTGWDEENDALNFSLSASSPTIRINQTGPATASVTFLGESPQYTDRGVHQVNVTVYQNSTPGKNSTQTFWINVTAPNRAPTLYAILNQTGIQGGNLTLQVEASDEDTEDTLLFDISATCAVNNPWNITTQVNMSNSTVNATGLINLTLSNDHVVCRTATIRVRDYENGFPEGGSASQVVLFDITNVNDAPVMQNLSYNVTNFKGQRDLRNLTAYAGIPFTYTANATDIDLLTYAGDTLNFSDNTTIFNISSAGQVSFTPADGDAGVHLINISVADANGSTSFETMNLTVKSNYPPAITAVPTITCQEDGECLYNFTATDNDADENVTFTSNSSLVNFTQLSYNISLFNRTFSNEEVGNYTVLVTATDVASHTNSTSFMLAINNTNDAPFFDGNRDNVSDSQYMPEPVVSGLQTEWLINASDLDFRNIAENLTFTAVIEIGPNASLFSIEKLSEMQARIRFTPSEADVGDYTLNLTVTDIAGANDSRLILFTVHNVSQSPVIEAAQPYHNGTTQVDGSLTNTTASNSTVTFLENTNVTYNISFTDTDSALVNLTVRYYRDGALMYTAPSTNPSYAVSYDYFSAGQHTMTAVVEDEYLSNDTFTWYVTVTNVNRGPVFTPTIPNRTLNSTTVLSYEMDNFIDPDDDRDSDGVIDGNESNTLVFTMSNSSYLTAAFSGFDVTLTPKASGGASVYYTATDLEGLQATSHNVTYTVFYTPDQSSSSTSSSSGGGGGGGAARVPQRVPQPKPYSLEIITPKPITIYANETVSAPLTLKNSGTDSLLGITLSAKSENEDLAFSFSDYQIAQLPVGGTSDVTLTIDGFREAGTIEVFVTADVQVPDFNDTAVIYINSIEQKKEGEEAVSLKITYARDFLSENPACGELVQLVDQAQQAYRNGDVNTAEELLSAVTEGCTFLKKQVAEEVQVPSALQALAGYRYINLLLGGVLLVLIASGTLLLLHYGRQQ